MTEDETVPTTIRGLYKFLKPEMDRNRDELKAEISKLSADLSSKITTNTDNIKSNTDIITTHDKTISELQTQVNENKNEILRMKIDANFHAQRERKHGMKLNMYEVKEQDVLMDENKLGEKVFKDLIEPMYQLAKKDGRLKAIPTRSEALDVIHVLPINTNTKKTPVGLPAPEKSIPQIQIKFRSTTFKDAAVRYKKKQLEIINGADGKVHMIDDRTPTNARCMALLRSNKRVDDMSVQIRSCRVRFKFKGDNTFTYVKNPFGATVDEAIK